MSMKRKVDLAFFIGAAKNIKYLPRIIWLLKNWPTYLAHYLGLKDGGETFYFRDGAVLTDVEGTLSGTIAVVFIRRNYGSTVGKSIVVEIGANIGTFAVYAASHTKALQMYCYEPIKSNYDLLLHNINLNSMSKRINAFNFAVAGQAGTRLMYLETSPEHSFIQVTTNSVSVPVQCVTLRDIFENNRLQKVDLLKINAEGAEYEIIYSAPNTCFEKIEEIRMEYHEDDTEGHDRATLQAFLEQRGYVTKHLYHHTKHEGFLWMAKAS